MLNAVGIPDNNQYYFCDMRSDLKNKVSDYRCTRVTICSFQIIIHEAFYAEWRESGNHCSRNFEKQSKLSEQNALLKARGVLRM